MTTDPTTPDVEYDTDLALARVAAVHALGPVYEVIGYLETADRTGSVVAPAECADLARQLHVAVARVAAMALDQRKAGR